MAAKKKGKRVKKHATVTVVQLRIEEVLRIRLDGAEFWDVCQYVSEKEKEPGSPWCLGKGEEPHCERTIHRYIAGADKRIHESCAAERPALIEFHLAKRRAIYARAVAQGDLRSALAVLKDEAELLGLYPDKDQELKDMLRDIGAKAERLGSGNHGTTTGSPAAQATDRVSGAAGVGG